MLPRIGKIDEISDQQSNVPLKPATPNDRNLSSFKSRKSTGNLAVSERGKVDLFITFRNGLASILSKSSSLPRRKIANRSSPESSDILELRKEALLHRNLHAIDLGAICFERLETAVDALSICVNTIANVLKLEMVVVYGVHVQDLVVLASTKLEMVGTSVGLNKTMYNGKNVKKSFVMNSTESSQIGVNAVEVVVIPILDENGDAVAIVELPAKTELKLLNSHNEDVIYSTVQSILSRLYHGYQSWSSDRKLYFLDQIASPSASASLDFLSAALLQLYGGQAAYYIAASKDDNRTAMKVEEKSKTEIELKQDGYLYQRLYEGHAIHPSIITVEQEIQSILMDVEGISTSTQKQIHIVILPHRRWSDEKLGYETGLFCIMCNHNSTMQHAQTSFAYVVPSLKRLQQVSDNKQLQLVAQCHQDTVSNMFRLVLRLRDAKDAFEMFSLVTHKGCEVFASERFSLFLADNIRNELWCMSSRDSVKGLRVPYGQGICGSVAASKKVIILRDVYADNRFDREIDKQTGFKTKTMMALPLISTSGALLGVIQAINRISTYSNSSGLYDSRDTALLQEFGDELAIELESKNQILAHTKVFVDAKNATAARDGLTKHDVKSISSIVQECMETSTAVSLVDCFPYVCLAISKLSGIKLRKKKKNLDRRCSRHLASGSIPITVELAAQSSMDELPLAMIEDEMGPGNCKAEDFESLELNVFSKSKAELSWYIAKMLDSMGLLWHFRIDHDQIVLFLKMMQDAYRDNLYHNYFHAFTVTHTTYYLVKRGNLNKVLTSLECLGAMIAAVGHDVDHPGHDNQTEIKLQSRLALRYNDISVLENHHCAMTFKIIKDSNVLSSISPSAIVHVRKSIISSILATDMKHHSTLLTDLSSKDRLDSFNSKLVQDRQLLLNAVIHASDLSSLAFPMPMAKKWTTRVCDEFRSQADFFRDQGWTVPPHMQHLDDKLTCMQLQVNFIDYLVCPLWTKIVSIIPQADEFLLNLRENRHYFSQTESRKASEGINTLN